MQRIGMLRIVRKGEERRGSSDQCECRKDNSFGGFGGKISLRCIRRGEDIMDEEQMAKALDCH